MSFAFVSFFNQKLDILPRLCMKYCFKGQQNLEEHCTTYNKENLLPVSSEIKKLRIYCRTF